MFTIDPKITEKDLQRKNIYKVLLSMNSHQVATPETSLEEARSYVFIFREGRNRLSAYIGLHLLITDRKLFYQHSANPFLEDELSEVESEARDFAEYMGALMDEVDFAGMSDLEHDHWIEEQGIFGTKTQQEAVTVEKPPVTEVVEATPVQPPAAPEQPARAAETTSAPELPAASVNPPSKTAAAVVEQPREVPVTETVKQDVQVQAPPLEPAKRQGETTKKEATTGTETPSKQAAKKKSLSATSVVSRDREALARLLTSF